MTKNWVKYYLLLGTVIVAILSFLCSVVFVKNNVGHAQEKKVFESIYKDTAIDFIIPSPSYSQIQEIEQNQETGVTAITPYYETSSSARINGNEAKGSVLFIADASKVDYTPYGTKRIVSGEKSVTEGNAIVDRTYIENNSCKIGDTVEMTLSGHQFTFTVTGMTEDNTYYNGGTIALVLSSEQVAQLESDGVGYSAAYVAASDYEKCKRYLLNEYKPYGRLKDESEFDNQEAYQQHVNNFNDANWSKEITNCKDNYSSLSVKYENVESGIYRNTIIAAVIVLLAAVIFNIVLLKNESLKNLFQGFLVKKSGTKSEIKSFYTRGITFNAIVFCLITGALYYWVTVSVGSKLIGSNLLTSSAMIISQIVASIIMSAVARGYVEKHYTIKKKETNTSLVGNERNDEK